MAHLQPQHDVWLVQDLEYQPGWSRSSKISTPSPRGNVVKRPGTSSRLGPRMILELVPCSLYRRA